MSTAASSVQCFITVNTKNLYCDTATVFTDQMSDTLMVYRTTCIFWPIFEVIAE